MEKHSLVCMTRLSLFCFLSLSFDEKKVIVGIVDAFNEKGYNVGCLVLAVQ